MTTTSNIVYIIEDDADGRLATQMLLELSGWKVTAFVSAEEFLAAFADLQPGCLLIDYRMPGMSGMQLVQLLRERGVHWPVVMLSGHAEPPTIEAALAAGVSEFLLKPVISADLRNSVRRQFDAHFAKASRD